MKLKDLLSAYLINRKSETVNVSYCCVELDRVEITEQNETSVESIYGDCLVGSFWVLSDGLEVNLDADRKSGNLYRILPILEKNGELQKIEEVKKAEIIWNAWNA